MPNMSYCRFENTSIDLLDCINAIEHGETEELNEYEIRGLKSLIESAHRILEMKDEGSLEHLGITS